MLAKFSTSNFSVWKNTGFFCRKSQFISYRELCNASQGMVCAPASVSSGKETPGYLCGPDPGWICAKVIKILFNLLLCDHQLQVASSHFWMSQRSPTDFKEVSEQAAGKVESLWLGPRSKKAQTLCKGRCRACLQRWYGGSSPGPPWCWECKKGGRSWLFCEEKPLPYLSLKLPHD